MKGKLQLVRGKGCLLHSSHIYLFRSEYSGNSRPVVVEDT